MNENIMRLAGFGKEMDRIKNGRCPFCLNPNISRADFRDELSWKEFSISGMCQKCQDEFFKPSHG